MIDEKAGSEFIEYFHRLVDFYLKFLELETGKYEIVKQNQLDQLDQILKDEQALTLKARGYEIERQKLMEKSEAPKAVFRDLISHFSPGQQQEVRSLYHTLSITLNHLKLTSDKTNRLIQLRLRRIAFLKARAQQSLAISSQKQSGNGILSKKI